MKFLTRAFPVCPGRICICRGGIEAGNSASACWAKGALSFTKIRLVCGAAVDCAGRKLAVNVSMKAMAQAIALPANLEQYCLRDECSSDFRAQNATCMGVAPVPGCFIRRP